MKPVVKILLGGTLLCFLLVPGLARAASADGTATEGLDLYRKQKFDEAAQKFLEARNGKPDDPKLSYNLGNSRYKQGKFDNALQDYSRTADDTRANPALKEKSVYNMGNAFFRMGKLEESAAAFKRALELNPGDMDAKFNLEFVREQIEKKKQEQKKQKQDPQGKDRKDPSSENDAQKQKDRDQDAARKDRADSQEPPAPDRKDPNNEPPARQAEAAPVESMTEEEAEQRLSALNEDIKKFQRRQALDMESLFTYQGKDW